MELECPLKYESWRREAPKESGTVGQSCASLGKNPYNSNNTSRGEVTTCERDTHKKHTLGATHNYLL